MRFCTKRLSVNYGSTFFYWSSQVAKGRLLMVFSETNRSLWVSKTLIRLTSLYLMLSKSQWTHSDEITQKVKLLFISFISDSTTVFENHPKRRIWIFQFWHFPLIFVLLSGNTVWPQTSGFQKLAKSDHFGIFNQLLSTQNVW